jgi:zinc protease
MNYIDEYVWTGKNLVKGQREAIESLTPQKIAAFLKKLVDSGNHVEVIMLPEEDKQ